jgi:hypothetical protein
MVGARRGAAVRKQQLPVHNRALAPPATQVMSDIARVGAAIEATLGSAQDVEGVVDPDGTVFVVQTRPQV